MGKRTSNRRALPALQSRRKKAAPRPKRAARALRQHDAQPQQPTKLEGWRRDVEAEWGHAQLARVELMLEHLAVHGIKNAACKSAHIAKDFVLRLCERFADLQLEIDDALRIAGEQLEATGMACARKAASDPRYQPSLIFALKAKRGWKDYSRIEHVGADDAPPIKTATLPDVSQLSLAEIERALQLAKEQGVKIDDAEDEHAPRPE